MVGYATEGRPCSYSRHPDGPEKGMERGRGNGLGWSACFIDDNDEDNGSHTGRGIPPQHGMSFTSVRTLRAHLWCSRLLAVTFCSRLDTLGLV